MSSSAAWTWSCSFWLISLIPLSVCGVICSFRGSALTCLWGEKYKKAYMCAPWLLLNQQQLFFNLVDKCVGVRGWKEVRILTKYWFITIILFKCVKPDFLQDPFCDLSIFHFIQVAQMAFPVYFSQPEQEREECLSPPRAYGTTRQRPSVSPARSSRALRLV